MMKTLTKTIFLELLGDSLEEELKSGDKHLTQKINNHPVMLVGSIDSSIRYVYGVSEKEDFGIISLN